MSDFIGICEHRISSQNTCPECSIAMQELIAQMIQRPVIDWIGTGAPDPRDAYSTRINGHVVGIHSCEEAAGRHACQLEAYINDYKQGGDER